MRPPSLWHERAGTTTPDPGHVVPLRDRWRSADPHHCMHRRPGHAWRRCL